MRPDWPIVIRQIIAATNCTMSDVAVHCGVCKSAVEQWLDGRKRPNFEHGWELLNAYVANVSSNIPHRELACR